MHININNNNKISVKSKTLTSQYILFLKEKRF